MQVCTSLQTDNHASTPLLSFLQAGCPSCRPTKHEEQNKRLNTQSMLSNILVSHSHSVFNHGGKKTHFSYSVSWTAGAAACNSGELYEVPRTDDKRRHTVTEVRPAGPGRAAVYDDPSEKYGPGRDPLTR